MASNADVIFYGGHIITMDEEGDTNTRVEALAVGGGRIIALGRIEDVFQFRTMDTEVIYLNKQTLMPGFIEPHHHIVMSARNACQFVTIGLDCRNYDDVKKLMLSRVAEIKNDTGKDQIAAFWGWDPERIPGLPLLTADFLDREISSTVPVSIRGQNAHVQWVNSVLLKMAKIDENTTVPGVEKDKFGKPTGQLFEFDAMNIVTAILPKNTREEMTDAIRKRFSIYANAGLTTVTDLIYKSFNDEALKTAMDTEDCPVRVVLYVDVASSGPSTIGKHSEKLWEEGVKILADGSPHCGTMAIREPFLYTPITEILGFPKPPSYGMLVYDNAEMMEMVTKYHAEGKQIAIHAHGERAVEQVLSTYEKVLVNDTSNTKRHRIEHCGLMTPEQIARAGKINIALSFFVDHLRFYGPTFKTEIFGDRTNRWAPVNEATKNGITWTIHQDHPAFPGDVSPFANMRTAITRCSQDDITHPFGPEYGVTIHEALKAYTINAAWQLHIEDKVGSLKVGKLADLVILSENPYNVNPFDLERIKVIDTFLGGKRTTLSEVKCLPRGDIQILSRV